MTNVGSAPEAHTNPKSKKRGGVRALKAVGIVVLAVGAVLVVQSTTGLACGSKLPGFGLVTCNKPSGGDVKDWFDARSKYIVAGVDFGHAKTACEITAMSRRGQVSNAAFGRCLNEQQAVYDEASVAVRRSAATMLVYLNAGRCRTAVTSWDAAAGSLQELAERLGSGSVNLSNNRVPPRIVNAWNAGSKIERTQGDEVVAACD